MPDEFLCLEWDFIESIRAQRSVPIKREGNVVAWMAEARFAPLLENKGFIASRGLMELPVQLNQEAGKLNP